MKETFALAGMLWTGIILCFALVAILHYGYGKVQGWRKKRTAKETLSPEFVEAYRQHMASYGFDFPRPMSCQPSKGWIKESRFTVYATNEREAIDALTSLETVDDG